MTTSIPPDLKAYSLGNGLIGTGFISQYQHKPRVEFKGPMCRCKTATHPFSH